MQFDTGQLLVAFICPTFFNTIFALRRGPVRQTVYGPVEGRWYKGSNTDAEIFLGIPYAKPPIGNLRFRLPVPPEPWNETLSVATQPSWCPQFWYDGPPITKRRYSEDCLYLSVYVPAKDVPTKGFPVIVWVHGGSFQVGGMAMFPMNSVITTLVSQGVVVVFMNYRLGPLGFLSLMHEDCPGNYGLEDQLAALFWVQANIANFSGNPNQVTLAGESAGAACVSLLAISPRVPQRLFHRAMIRSGSALAPWAVRSVNTDLNSITLTKLLGCSAKYVHDVVACMRNVSVDSMVAAWRRIANDDIKAVTNRTHRPAHYNHPFFAHTYFTPVVDSYLQGDSLLPSYPENLMRDHARIPLLLGHTTAECMGYTTWLVHGAKHRRFWLHDLDFVVPNVLYGNPEQVKEAVYFEYFKNRVLHNDHDIIYRVMEIASDQNFVVPSVEEAMIYASKGVPVYAYVFGHWNRDLADVLEKDGIKEMRAAGHGFDLVFLFRSTLMFDGNDNLTLRFSAEDDAVSTLLSNTVAGFVKDGKPLVAVNSAFENYSINYRLNWPQYSNTCGLGFFYETSPRFSPLMDDTRYHFWAKSVPLVQTLTLSEGYVYQQPIDCGMDQGNPQERVVYRTAFFCSLIAVVLLLLCCTAMLCLYMCKQYH